MSWGALLILVFAGVGIFALIVIGQAAMEEYRDDE